MKEYKAYANTTAIISFFKSLFSLFFWTDILKNYSEIGKRYAKALFELAEESKLTSKVENDLNSFSSLLNESSDLSKVLSSPTVSKKEQSAFIIRLMKSMKANDLTIKFFALVTKNGRISIINEIIVSYLQKLAEIRGELTAEVTSAHPLANDIKKIVHETISNMTKAKKISLDTKVDKSLLGGIVIRVGSTMVDSSIKTQLSRLNMNMKGV